MYANEREWRAGAWSWWGELKGVYSAEETTEGGQEGRGQLVEKGECVGTCKHPPNILQYKNTQMYKIRLQVQLFFPSCFCTSDECRGHPEETHTKHRNWSSDQFTVLAINTIFHTPLLHYVSSLRHCVLEVWLNCGRQAVLLRMKKKKLSLRKSRWYTCRFAYLQLLILLCINWRQDLSCAAIKGCENEWRCCRHTCCCVKVSNTVSQFCTKSNSKLE